MGNQLFSNNAVTTLNGAISNSATSLVVSSTVNFPVISNTGDYFYITITNAISNYEILKVTATTGTTFTVVRGVDNTTALAWSTGMTVEINPIAQGLRDIVSLSLPSSISYTATGGSTSASLQSVLDSGGVNVMSFGAIPNNLTFDQSTAFNNAIAYAAANKISKVIIPCGCYACNILITQNNIYLEGNQSGSAVGNSGAANVYLTPWTIANPDLQVGNDTGTVSGVTLSNIVLNGLSPNGNGQIGLFLGGGCNSLNINSVNAGYFVGTAILLGPSNSYPVEYINFSNCNWFGAFSAYTSVFGAYSTGSSWTSATYLTNCNVQSNSNGYAIIISGTGITWNGGWIQASSGGGIKFGTGGSLTGSGTNMEVNSPYDAIDIPDTVHVAMSEWVTGNFTITSGSFIKDSGGTTHAINTNGGLVSGSEIGKNCSVIGDLFFTGADGNGGTSTADNMHISGGYDATNAFDMVNSVGTAVNTRLLSDGTFRVMANGGTGMIVNPRSSAVYYFNVWPGNTSNVSVQLQARDSTGTVAIPLNLVTQASAPVQANGSTILSTARAISSHTAAAPTGTTSTTAVMMAAGSTITPVLSTRIMITISGQMANSTAGDGATVDVRYGTGTAPSNGAAVSGTLVGIAQTSTSVSAGQKSGFSISYIVTGLTISTAYWFDVSLMAVTGGTATITGVSATAMEV